MGQHIVQLQMRRDLAANWTSENPILLDGQIGFETDTRWHKVGDGVTAWTGLLYYHGPPWIEAIDGGSPSSEYLGVSPDFNSVMVTEP